VTPGAAAGTWYQSRQYRQRAAGTLLITATDRQPVLPQDGVIRHRRPDLLSLLHFGWLADLQSGRQQEAEEEEGITQQVQRKTGGGQRTHQKQSEAQSAHSLHTVSSQQLRCCSSRCNSTGAAHNRRVSRNVP
jgi:hypothetical protein